MAEQTATPRRFPPLAELSEEEFARVLAESTSRDYAEGEVILHEDGAPADHLYVIRTEEPGGLMAHLKNAGIGTGIHYPIPLHLQKAYQFLGYSVGDFPVCEKAAAQIVSLPMFPKLLAEQQARVVSEVLRFLRIEIVPQHVGSGSALLNIRERTA